MNAPAFQFYVRDWLGPGDVRRMTLEERALYCDLLCYSWDKGGIPPEDIAEPSMLARMVGCSVRKFNALWAKIQHKFATDSRGFRVNDRLEKEREKLASFSQKQSEKALKSWENRKKSTIDDMPRQYQQASERLCSASASSFASAKHRSASADPPRPNPPKADPQFNLLSLYELYPRKGERKPALAKLEKQIRTPGDFAKCEAGIRAYADACRRNGTKEEYIASFLTFVNQERWVDWAEKASAAPAVTIPNVLLCSPRIRKWVESTRSDPERHKARVKGLQMLAEKAKAEGIPLADYFERAMGPAQEEGA